MLSTLPLLLAPLATALGGLLAPVPSDGALTAVPFQAVAVRDPFFSPRIRVGRARTLEACLARCVETGRIANFRRAAGWEPGGHQGLLYDDSDVYKVVEGAAKCLALFPDPELEARVAEVVRAIVAAQDDTGYVGTYVLLDHPELRWKNLAHGHELYCGGHMIEAALAWERATGRDELLGAALRFAELAWREFGPDGRLVAPGHQEIELALLALGERTGDPRWARLAERFLEARGAAERRERGELYGTYSQDARRVWEERTAVGHAVRAMYQYCAMTDVVRAGRQDGGLDVLRELWADVATKTYVTGGIGSEASIEGFGAPFDLPLASAYCETCASVGLALWSWRMWLATGEASYADTLELELYNNVLAGVGLTGERFFYGNPLESEGGHGRVPWFDCSCCPTNLVRTLPGIGGMAYAWSGDALSVGLYVAGDFEAPLAGGALPVRVEGAYPWEGGVRVHLDARDRGPFTLRLRRPAWCAERPRVRVDGREVPCVAAPGTWIELSLEGGAQREVALDLPLVPRRVRADGRVAGRAGRVALRRGPLVYAVEGVDHGGRVTDLVLPPDASLTARWRSELLGGCVTLEASARALRTDGTLVTEPLVAVPYAAWGNRGDGPMEVWIAERAAAARIPGERFTARADGCVYRASHCWHTDTVAAVGDGRWPATSADASLPRLTFWDHRGSDEWVRVDFEPGPRTVDRSRVYWFDDTGVGACRVPAAWSLEWLPATESADAPDDAWRPVRLVAGDYACDRDRAVLVRFEPVDARALRLRVTLSAGVSAGVLEWAVGAE